MNDVRTRLLGNILRPDKHIARAGRDLFMDLDPSKFCIFIPCVPETGDEHPLEYRIGTAIAWRFFFQSFVAVPGGPAAVRVPLDRKPSFPGLQSVSGDRL